MEVFPAPLQSCQCSTIAAWVLSSTSGICRFALDRSKPCAASACKWTRVRCSGLVGESGSGKSATALAILGLLGPAAQVAGQILWRGSRSASATGGRSAAVARTRDCHDLPGADDGAESSDADWPPGSRRSPGASLSPGRAERRNGKRSRRWKLSIFPKRRAATATIHTSFRADSGSGSSSPWHSSTGRGC